MAASHGIPRYCEPERRHPSITRTQDVENRSENCHARRSLPYRTKGDGVCDLVGGVLGPKKVITQYVFRRVVHYVPLYDTAMPMSEGLNDQKCAERLLKVKNAEE